MSILEKFTEIANSKYDGHFTIMKFTTNYRACFGTLIELDPFITMYMAKGETLDEALQKAIDDKIDCYVIDDLVNKEM